MFGSLLVSGVTCWIAYDALLNIAVMTAVIPPTGVPLPFISFGGSSLVATLAGVGLMLNVSRAASRSMIGPVRKQE
jgi:cell division protein FtsW